MADKDQSEKFKKAAREAGADEDEARWKKRFRRIARPTRKAKPD